jgi:hypothetical protein
MNVRILELFYNRYLVLNSLYEKVEGKKEQLFNIQEISYDLGIKNGKFLDCFGYLSSEDLIKVHSKYKVSITHLGIRLIEQSQLNPNNRINDFPSLHELDLA